MEPIERGPVLAEHARTGQYCAINWCDLARWHRRVEQIRMETGMAARPCRCVESHATAPDSLLLGLV